MTVVVAPHRPRVAPVSTPSPRPLLIELIGLAGAGKTTLVRAVASRVAGARGGLRLDRVRDLPAVAGAAGRIAPAFIGGLLARSPTARHDAWYSVRLLAHRAAARRALASQATLVLIDEGPVYMLARLLAFGSAGDRSGFGVQWDRSLEWWRRRLDAIVWLDAPDATLVARIRCRAKNHRAKHVSDRELGEFLSRYRAAYAAVVTLVTAQGGPRVVRLDASEPVDLGVDRLLDALGLGLRPSTGAA